MEEALVINWLTRAFARLVFTIDVTGLSSKEAEGKIRAFKKQLTTMSMESGTTEAEKLSIATDIYIGASYHEVGGKLEKGLSGVDVLDTASTGFQDLSPVEYYRNKIIMGTRVPKAYFGIEEDVNAKATLTREDIRFAGFLRTVQSLGSRAIVEPIRLSLALQGIDPKEVDLIIWWPNPSAQDPVEHAQAYYYNARADEIYMSLGVLDRQYAAERHVEMSSAEWSTVRRRVDAEGIPSVRKGSNGEGEEPEGREGNMRGGVLQTSRDNGSGGSPEGGRRNGS
jgi:hypothetical protein